jgi:hypothetical protein
MMVIVRVVQMTVRYVATKFALRKKKLVNLPARMIVTAMAQPMAAKFVETISVHQHTSGATVFASLLVIAQEPLTVAVSVKATNASFVLHFVEPVAGMIQTAKMPLMAANTATRSGNGVYPDYHIVGNIVNLTENAKELEMAALYVTLKSECVSISFLNAVMAAMMTTTVKEVNLIVYIAIKVAAHLRKLDRNAKTAVLMMTIAL